MSTQGLTNMNNMSKEERELMVQQKMERMKKQNEEIMKRHAEIEEDKKSADMFSTSVANHRKTNPVQNIVVERKPNPRPPRAQRKLEEQGRVNADQRPASQDTESKRSQRLSAGDGPPPDPSFNYLSDPFREGNFREDRNNNHNNNNGRGGRNYQNNFRNQEYRNMKPGGSGGGGGGPHRRNQERDHQRDQRSKCDMSSNRGSSMSGRDRLNYEDWKAERQKIDEERIARQKTASGEWRREWDVDKRFIEEENHANQQGGFYRRPSWERGRGGGGNKNGENNHKNYSNTTDYQNRNDRQDHRGRGRENSRGGHNEHRNSNFDEQHQSGTYNNHNFERGRGRGQARGGMRGSNRGYPRGILPRRTERWSSSSAHSDNSVDQNDDRAWLEDDATPARDVTVNVDNTLTINVKGGISENDTASKNHTHRPSYQSSHADSSRANSMPSRTNARNVGSGRIRPPMPQTEERQGFPGREHVPRGRGGNRGGRGGFRRGGPGRNFDHGNGQLNSSNGMPVAKISQMQNKAEEDWDNTPEKPAVQSNEVANEAVPEEWEVTQQQLEWQNSETGEWELPQGQAWKAAAVEEVNEDSWEDVTSGGESQELSGQSEEVSSKLNGELKTENNSDSAPDGGTANDEGNVFLNEDATSGNCKQRSVSLASGYEEDEEFMSGEYADETNQPNDEVLENTSSQDSCGLPTENNGVQAVVDALKQDASSNIPKIDSEFDETISSVTSKPDVVNAHPSDDKPVSSENIPSEAKVDEKLEKSVDKECSIDTDKFQSSQDADVAVNEIKDLDAQETNDNNLITEFNKTEAATGNVGAEDPLPEPVESSINESSLNTAVITEKRGGKSNESGLENENIMEKYKSIVEKSPTSNEMQAGNVKEIPSPDVSGNGDVKVEGCHEASVALVEPESVAPLAT